MIRCRGIRFASTHLHFAGILFASPGDALKFSGCGAVGSAYGWGP